MGIVSASLFMWANVGQAQFTVGVGPVVGGYGSGEVGTVESSAEHGWADVIRSQGYYNLTTGQGAVEFEKARRILLENNQAAYRGRVAAREENMARVAQRRERERHSPESLLAAAKSEVAAPLSADVLNPTTGMIAWPKALLDNKFSAKRNELEKLFELRTRTSNRPASNGPNSQARIEATTMELTALLKTTASSNQVSATEYMRARRFLDSMAATAGRS
jgi:hypothetical protein